MSVSIFNDGLSQVSMLSEFKSVTSRQQRRSLYANDPSPHSLSLYFLETQFQYDATKIIGTAERDLCMIFLVKTTFDP